MGKKKKLSRKNPVQVSDPRRKAEEHLAAGRFRQAADIYKVLCKTDRDGILTPLKKAYRGVVLTAVGKGAVRRSRHDYRSARKDLRRLGPALKLQTILCSIVWINLFKFIFKVMPLDGDESAAGLDDKIYLRSGAYCTSSKIIGGGCISRKPRGSSLSDARISGGSRET